MIIKIKSDLIREPENLLYLISRSDDMTMNFKLLQPQKGQRPVITVAAVISGLKVIGAGGIIVALINAVKDYKIKKMELKFTEKQNEKDRDIKREEIEASKESERLKLEAERKKIVLQGNIEIVGNYVDTILKENRDDKISVLKQLGFKFDKNIVTTPANFDLNKETIETLDSVLQLSAVKEIVHIEKG